MKGAECHAWRTWPQVFGIQGITATYYTAMIMYTALGVSSNCKTQKKIDHLHKSKPYLF
jgi:hypothetical protein